MTVVVGVDGLPHSLAAIWMGHEEAEYRDARLVAVMAYSDLTVLGAPAGVPMATPSVSAAPVSAAPVPAPPPVDDDAERRRAESTLRAAVMDAVGSVERIELRVAPGLAGRVLVDTAHDVGAQLVVVAARSERSPARLLGVASQYVLRNAHCPVLVVPENYG